METFAKIAYSENRSEKFRTPKDSFLIRETPSELYPKPKPSNQRDIQNKTATTDMPPRTSTKPKLLDQVRLAIRARRYTILFLYRHVLNKDVSTTMIYTHVLNRGGHGVFSPADRL